MMMLTPFEETYSEEVHHFNNGDIVTATGCHKHFVAHVDDACIELTRVKGVFNLFWMADKRFHVNAVFTEMNEDDCFTDRIIVQVGYGMNGGTPEGCTHDEKWVWYTEQIADILRHMYDSGFGCPSLLFVNDPHRNDIYTCWIECYNIKDKQYTQEEQK